MEILDNELDSTGLTVDAPGLSTFYNAWIGRTGDAGRTALDSILSSFGISAYGDSISMDSAPIVIAKPKNLPMPIFGASPFIPQHESQFPVGYNGGSESHTEYEYEIDIDDPTPIKVARDYSYIGSNYLNKSMTAQVNAEPIEYGIYTIQPTTATGLFLDAKESGNHLVVAKSDQDNDSQRWILTPQVDGTYTIQHKVNGRFLDAILGPVGEFPLKTDFSALTRNALDNDSQRWILAPQVDGSYTIQQKINGKFLEFGQGLDWQNGGVGTCTVKCFGVDDSQRWILNSAANALSDSMTISFGLSNLNSANMGVLGMSGSTLSATDPTIEIPLPHQFDITVSQTEGYGYGVDGFLVKGNWITPSVTTGSLDPRTQTLLDLNFSPHQAGLYSGTKTALIEILFQPDSISSTASQVTRTIEIEFHLLDGPDDDFDSDGFTSKQEVEDLPNYNLSKYDCLDPSNADSDGDGLNDGTEELLHGTLPCDSDTDSDSIKDGYEVNRDCLDPLVKDAYSDPDGDGLSNYEEYKGQGVVFGEDHWISRTSPCNPDTDGDGVNDNVDNCAVTANADQANHDDDVWGDACDLDDDNDKCPDDGDHDPFDKDVFMDCYKLPYSTRVQMGFIDPLRDLIFMPNEEYMVLRVVPPKPGGDPRCGRLGCPPPHVRITDRDHNVLHKLNPERYGFSMDDGFGMSATWVEDLDGDRVRDLILGVPFAVDINRAGQAGAVLAISTRTGDELGRINGSVQGSHFGHSIVALGGKHIAVGAPGSGAVGRNAGTVSLIDLENFSISSVYQTGENNDGFGHAMFGLPDVDGDGIGELIIGAPAHRSAGAVFLANSSSSKIELLAAGRGTDSSFGFAITSLGDIDGDRVIDLIVGAPNSEGIGSVTMLDLNGKITWSVTGDTRGEMFGTSLAAYEQTDPRSSTAMFIAGAPGYGRNNGAVYKISALGESKLLARGNSEEAQLGSSVALMPGSKRNNGDLFVFGDLNNETNTHQSLFTNEILNSGAELERQATRSATSS
jgi:hypothetical protein